MNERLTVRPLLVLLPLAVAITFGCAKQETFSLPLESDPFFLGSQRTVIRPFGNPWIIHYFPNESQEEIVSRIESSEFFKQHEFRRVIRLRDGTYSASLPAKVSGNSSAAKSIGTIHIYPGQLTSELKAMAGSSGATVHLIPLIPNEN